MRTLFQFTQSCFGGVMIGVSWLNYSSMNSKILAGGNWKSGAFIRISEWRTLLHYPMIVNEPFCFSFKKRLFCMTISWMRVINFFVLYCTWGTSYVNGFSVPCLLVMLCIFWILYHLTLPKTWPWYDPKRSPGNLLTKSTCTMTQLILSLFKVVVTYAIYFYLILQHTSF